MIKIAFSGPLMFCLGSICYELFIIKGNDTGNIIVDSFLMFVCLICILFSNSILKVKKINNWIKKTTIFEKNIYNSAVTESLINN